MSFKEYNIQFHLLHEALPSTRAHWNDVCFTYIFNGQMISTTGNSSYTTNNKYC